ncbi:hypothetical protein NEOLI_004667 [Neolecta irregularis DAH-3]|uniref:Uncharacterized protein n=1 Tax=Neolecta irregularis (strain DAH-3) TaxID=1198029 RepID=A0A1U7LKM7_NEOID|nr:hypothetical protein NEOLI_004667 [Neolecta irregularis DAH-3]|eukprot:OLL23210.1 hypothetical protein NEOLI_004667 [Neolecta irregularis DAH-3]
MKLIQWARLVHIISHFIIRINTEIIGGLGVSSLENESVVVQKNRDKIIFVIARVTEAQIAVPVDVESSTFTRGKYENTPGNSRAIG